MFVTIQNLSGTKNTNPNYKKYFWFGIPIYDARYVNIPNKPPHLDQKTKSFIYRMEYTHLSNTSVHSGSWVNLNANILPSIKKALTTLNNRL